MTIAPQPTGRSGEQSIAPIDLVTVTVDGIAVQVPKGSLVIRVAEQMGIEIPRFCDHPLLDPVAACRMCLIEIEGMPKPQPACAITVTDGMVVRTQRTSEVADKAQEGVMEFLLLNHPLDCPICDKGGECPLQNQAMSAGRGESRFEGTKRTFPKPINVSAQILLDRERCVSCARCTRFADQIAGDPMLELLERGAQQQVGVAEDAPFDSYFSGNTIQICPVGALTSSLYRFRSRPFDLVSTPTACEHCASGCALRTDVRRGEVTRRLAWDDPEVNEEWNCDKGRFAFRYLHEGRIESPLVREDGQLRPASWPEAIDIAARGLAAADSRVGVLTGGRLTREDAYAYAKFARAVLHTDDIDFRARISSDEEAAFLAAVVAGRPLGPTYADLDAAPAVVLVGFEPEDESPIVFLRLRRAARAAGTRVLGVSARHTGGLRKMDGQWVPCQPGAEGQLLRSALDGADDHGLAAALREPGAVLLVGERLAAVPGALSAAAALSTATGAALGWVPRRAGERGALDAGAVAGLLPGGRSISDPQARIDVAGVWGVSPDDLPRYPGRRDTAAICHAVTPSSPASRLPVQATMDEETPATALLIAGVEPADDPARETLLAACEGPAFVVAVATHHSEVTERADVVFPVAAVAEKAGSFTDWEGRVRTFGPAIRDSQALPDGRVLAMIADAMDAVFGSGEVVQLRAELQALDAFSSVDRPSPPDTAASAPADSGLRLASWRLLLDRGVLQEGEPHLAATARPTVAVMSAATAAAQGVADADFIRVVGPRGSIEVPLELDEVVHDTVWLPMHSPDCSILLDLGARPGDIVRVERAAGAMEASA
jgi:NADH-quinone oxidoreductase subunit G